MFEDVLTWRRLFTTGSKPKRLMNLREERAFAKVASDIEKEGDWNFSDSERFNVLRRIREIYNERPFPQATFEDWHSAKKRAVQHTNESDSDSSDNSDSDSSNSDSSDSESDPETDKVDLNADFDAFVKKSIIQELKGAELRDSEPGESHSDSGAGPSVKRRKVAESTNLDGNSDSDSSSDDSSDSDSSDSDSSDSDSTDSDSSNSESSDSASSESDSSESDSSSEDSDTESKKPKPSSKSARDKNNSEEVENNLDEEESLNPDIIFARKKLKQWSRDTTDRSWYRKQHTLDKAGLEACGEGESASHKSAKKQHIVTLKTLLHLKVLEKDWQTAYKTFALLTKIPNVDLRSLWPVGVEILTQLRDEARENSSNGITKGRPEQIKIRQFFEWMTLSFPMQGKPLFSAMPNHGPVFRTGSKTYSPIYKVAQLFNLLTEKRYTLLRDNIEELLLMPPYDQDGAFHYIFILCCLSENADLLWIYDNFDNIEELMESDVGDLADETSLLASRETLKSRISSNHAEISSMMERCQLFNFEFPRDLVEKEMENTRLRLGSASSKPDGSQEHFAEPKKFSGYCFQKGRVIPAKTEDVALPRKYWDRLTVATDKGGTKHWVGRFFDYSKQNKAMCLLCGEFMSSRQRQVLKSHLESHDITSENHKDEQASLKNFDMAEMVKRQKVSLEQSKPKPVKRKVPSSNRASKTTSVSSDTSKTEANESDTPEKETASVTSKGHGSLELSKRQNHKLFSAPSDVSSEQNEKAVEELTDGFEIPDGNKTVGDIGYVSQDNENNLDKSGVNTTDELTTLSNEQKKDPNRAAIVGEKDREFSGNDTIPDFNQNNDELSIKLGDTENNLHKSTDPEPSSNESSVLDPPEYDTGGGFLANNIDDSMDGQRIARSQQTKKKSFEGFSPDTTLENQTFAHDISRDISRDFHQFASQTQGTQRPSQSLNDQQPSNNASHNWREEFSSDSNYEDTSVNFTRFIPDSILAEEGVQENGGKELHSTDNLIVTNSISDED